MQNLKDRLMTMNIFEYLFSVKNDSDKIHKNITILGITIKIKKNKKPIKPIKIQNWGVTISDNSIAILANGPSLRDTFNDVDDYKFIAKKDIFVMNSFMQDEQFFVLKPKYLCIMDEAYWIQPKHLHKRFEKDREQLKKVNWDMIFFMPKQAKQDNAFKKLLSENKYIKPKYINITTPFKTKDKYLFNLYKENKAMPEPQSVLVACIYIAINLGYKNIFLYGADNSWHLSLIVNDDNIPCFMDKHFYDKKEVIKYEPLYKTYTDKEFVKIREEFEAMVILHKSYEKIREYSQVMGSNIYNLSKFSCIDVFDRKFVKQEKSN